MSGCEYTFLDANTPEDHVDLIKEAFDQDPEALKACKKQNVLYAVKRLRDVNPTAALWLDLHSLNGAYV